MSKRLNKCSVKVSNRRFTDDKPHFSETYVAFGISNKGEVPVRFLGDVYLSGDCNEFTAIPDADYVIQSDIEFLREGQEPFTVEELEKVNFEGKKLFVITEIKVR